MAAKKPAPRKAAAKSAKKTVAPSTAAKSKIPARKKAAPKSTQSPAKPSPKAKARGDMTKPGPLGAKNGSGSIPMQGSAPQSMGGIGLGGYGM
jgi:hypothetical protein